MLVRLPLVLCLVLGVGASFAGCHGDESSDDEGKPHVKGSEGRERWIITFDGAAPDRSAWRAIAGDPEKAEAFAEKARAKLKTDHADVEGQIATLGGAVVEVWWMSNAITVEIEAAKVESLKALTGKLGVKSVSPDVPLGG